MPPRKQPCFNRQLNDLFCIIMQVVGGQKVHGSPEHLHEKSCSPGICHLLSAAAFKIPMDAAGLHLQGWMHCVHELAVVQAMAWFQSDSLLEAMARWCIVLSHMPLVRRSARARKHMHACLRHTGGAIALLHIKQAAPRKAHACQFQRCQPLQHKSHNASMNATLSSPV